jgi:4-aminobutyrate aminotransferase
MGRSGEIINRDKSVISPSYTRTYPLVIERGEGAYLWDVDGKKYLDFTSCIAVANVGHANPEVIEAIKEQADKITHNSGTDFYNALQVEMAERLTRVTPGEFEKRVFFCNSGTEAVECAFKLARWHTKRQTMISFLGAFHGRTFGSLTLSASRALHKSRFAPLVPSVVHSPYAYCFRCVHGEEYPECNVRCVEYIEEEILGKLVTPEEVAGIIVEPIQGEGGYIVPPLEFHRRLEALSRKHGFFLIVDEVQTGFGRSGEMFASQVYGVTPDAVALAKAIAGGVPMGACVARKEIMSWPRGAHASTFAGNPLACAAAIATLEFIERRRLWENASQLGEFGLKFLRDLKDEIPLIGDVRGLGLMLAVELVRDEKTKKPATVERDKALFRAYNAGLLLLSGGESSIRIAPPLVISEDEFEKGLHALGGVLKEL